MAPHYIVHITKENTHYTARNINKQFLAVT